MNKYTEAIQGDDVVILCDGIPMGEGRYWPPDVTEMCNYKMLPIDAQETDTKEGRSNG